jgi:hypothetical protein
VDDDELKHSVCREQQRVLCDQHTASHIKVENCADNEGVSVDNDLNSVKDIPKVYVNFIVTVVIVSEKKIRCITSIPPLVECLSFQGLSFYHVRDCV